MTPRPRHAAGARATLRALDEDRRGVVSIEFGLVIGLLIMIVVATVEFGRALAAQNEMSHALGRVTRVVNLNSSTTTDAIVELLEEYLDGYDERELDVDITRGLGNELHGSIGRVSLHGVDSRSCRIPT